MRVFLVGDCESDNGPGIANRKIRDALGIASPNF